jgi:hypothetical protein
VFGSLAGSGVCLGDDSPETVKQAVRSRLASLQNVVANYTVDKVYTPSREDIDHARRLNARQPAGETRLLLVMGSDASEAAFSFLEGKAKYEQSFKALDYAGLGKEGLPGFPDLQVMAFPGRTAEVLTASRGRDYKGVITNDLTLPRADLEVGLGMRAFGHDEWLTAADVEQTTVQVMGNTAELLYVDQTGTQHRWRLDRELGYAPTTYERTLGCNDKLNHVMTIDRYETVAGLFLPHEITLYTLNTRGEESSVLIKTMVKVVRYRINDPQNAAENYHIQWPRGTLVHDRILGASYTSDGTGLLPARYADEQETLRHIAIGGPATDTRRCFLPRVQVARGKNDPYILDLARGELVRISGEDELGRDRSHAALVTLGKGDLAWDGSLLALRQAKAFSLSRERQGQLRFSPSQYAVKCRLPANPVLPCTLVVERKEGNRFLVRLLAIQDDGVEVEYGPLVSR